MKWLSIIGVGEDGLVRLSEAAKTLIEQADVLISSERLFDLLDLADKEQIVWDRDFSNSLQQILSLKPKQVCILATGDPMFFGIGSTLSRFLSADEIEVIPSASIFSLICAKLMWSQRSTVSISLHGRELNSLKRFLQPGAQLIVLSHDGETPIKVAQLLCDCGYAQSTITVFEHLAGIKEKISQTSAAGFEATEYSALNTIAIQCITDQPITPISRIPGLDDHYYNSDGVMTKKHIRALTLGSLAPRPNEVLWDIGAGTGTIAIEWLRSVEGTTAYAIEDVPKRINYIRQNANDLGVPELHIIQSRANPQSLNNLPPPNAIFIGGGSSDYELIEYCWHRLQEGGRLVINSVSIDAEQNLLKSINRFGGELSRIAIEHLQSLGKQQAWKPERTISHYHVVKGQS